MANGGTTSSKVTSSHFNERWIGKLRISKTIASSPNTTNTSPSNCGPRPYAVVLWLDLMGEVEKVLVKSKYQPVAVHMVQNKTKEPLASSDVIDCRFIQLTNKLSHSP